MLCLDVSCVTYGYVKCFHFSPCQCRYSVGMPSSLALVVTVLVIAKLKGMYIINPRVKRN